MTRQWEVAWGRRTWPNRHSSELGVAATVLAGVAWLTLVLGLRWQLRTKAVAALPGTGYITVAVITISAILTVIMTLRRPQRGADDDPRPGHESELRTLA
jgi:hypothetical protein